MAPPPPAHWRPRERGVAPAGPLCASGDRRALSWHAPPCLTEGKGPFPEARLVPAGCHGGTRRPHTRVAAPPESLFDRWVEASKRQNNV